MKMVKTGEGFYSSLGFAPLPETFWERSLIIAPARPRGRLPRLGLGRRQQGRHAHQDVHARSTRDDFVTVHHELGHNFYQRAYTSQPYLFSGGANDGFHEAIGDFVALSAHADLPQPDRPARHACPGADEDIPFLLKMALDKIAFLPFGLLVDKWRWEVFSGEITPEQYNEAWWELRAQYQGIAPPGPRPADAFDPGAKYHIPGNTPYTRYFLARIFQFQFHRAACEQAGWKGPLHRCSIYGNKEVGEKFNAHAGDGPVAALARGARGLHRRDATSTPAPMVDYFAPLNAWLTEQNKGETCGW